MSSDGESQETNPEVRSVGLKTTIVRDQIFALTTITNRLRSAFNGQDVDWIDTGDYPQINRWYQPITSNFSKRDRILIINFILRVRKVNKPCYNGSLDVANVYLHRCRASSSAPSVIIIFDFAEDTWYGSGSGSGDGSFTDDEDGFKESSGYGPQPSEPEPPKQPPPVVHEVETPPRMDIEPKGAGSTNNQTTAMDNGASRQKMSLTRAMTTYLLPIIVMWFGGCITELL